MKSLWRAMDKGWALIGPEPALQHQLGHGLQQLNELGLLRREPYQEGGSYPCTYCSQNRRVVEYEGTWAVCTSPEDACEPMDISTVDRVEVDETGIAGLLREVLRLDGPAEPLHPARPVRVGDRALGGRRVVFAFVRPLRARERDVLDWIRLQPEAGVVLLQPRRSNQPDWALPRGATWVALDDHVDLAQGVADLSSVAIGMDLEGQELAQLLRPKFDLVIDRRGAGFYGGARVGQGRSERLLQLLRVLASRPGEWLSRREIQRELYPDEVTNRGRLLTDPETLDRRLRQQISSLGKALANAGESAGLKNPIENLRARSDTEGGYRLSLLPSRIYLRGELR